MAIRYASPTDLQRLTLNSSFLQGVSVAEQISALEAAADMADSYLASQFILPLKSWGQDLVLCVCCLARYELAVRRGYNPDAGADANLRQRYTDCIEWLTKVSEGDLTPNVIDSSGGVARPFVVSSTSRGFSARNTELADDPGPFEGDGNG